MGEPIRAAIVGTGNIARAHVRALRAFPDRVTIVAGHDIDAERLAAFCSEHDIAGRYDSLSALLAAETPDLLHICTPPGGHADQAVAGLESGATVVCEKPPCLSLAEFDRILDAEKRGGGRFVGVFQHRFGSSARHAKRLIDEGTLGRPLVAVCHTLWYRDDAYFEVPWRGRWETEGGGPTMGHGVHQIDLLGHLLGDWTEISATAGRLARHVETEDVSFAHLTFANGAIASIINSVLSPRQETYVRLDLTDATVELTHLYGYSAESWRYTPAPGVTGERVDAWRPPEPDVPSSHAAQIADLIDRITDGRPLEPSPQSVRRTLEIITGLYASAFTGERVKRADLAPGHPYYERLHGEPA